MQYSVVKIDKDKGRTQVKCLNTKRDMVKYVKDLGVRPHGDQIEFSNGINCDKDGNQYLIFRGTPEIMKVEVNYKF